MRLNEFIKSNKFANEKHKVSVNILYAAYWLKDHFTTTLKPHDITIEQYNVMRILKDTHPDKMRVKDIASRMVEKSSNVPRIIDKLVIKDFARRSNSDEDKRNTFVSLSKKGIYAIEQARTSIEQTSKKTLMITDWEAKKLNEMLWKIMGV